MVAVIKKGTNPQSFRLKGGKILTFEPDILTVISDSEYEALMAEYGSFITPRILTDENPSGCFIISTRNANASDQSKEVGKVEDGSSPIKVKKRKAKK